MGAGAGTGGKALAVAACCARFWIFSRSDEGRRRRMIKHHSRETCGRVGRRGAPRRGRGEERRMASGKWSSRHA